MKSLLLSLLLFAFAQGAQAEVNLNESQSKKLYNILAAYGLRTPDPSERKTREWAKPAGCEKTLSGGVSYTCQVYDEYHGVNVVKTGASAKKLYDFLAYYVGTSCEVDCRTGSPQIICVYWWPNKDNPPERRYACSIWRYPEPNLN